VPAVILMAMPHLFVSRSIRAKTAARQWIAAAVAGAACASSGAAGAHGFGERYELPLPLSLYLVGGAAVVGLSFLVFALFVREQSAHEHRAGVNLLARPVGRAMTHWGVRVTLKTATLALFLLAILAGLLGNQNPYRNIAPTLVWIIWWVGFAYISAFGGNLWLLVSPWRTLYDAAAWLSQRMGLRGPPTPRLVYPRALGVWPACALLFAFAFIELIYPNSAVPAIIGALAVAYSLLTFTGMFAFGRDGWLQHAEVFQLFFGLFAKLAPFEAPGGNGLLLRPPGSGLLKEEPISTSAMAFVLLMLATVLFDGLIGTPEWSEFERIVSAAIPQARDASLIIKTAALLAVWLLFLGAYLGICAGMSAMVAGGPAPIELARGFALTLIPIAIGYHVAHYLVYLLIQGQYIIPLISDPLGYGWNLLGTAGYRVDIALAGARFAWYVALAAIVTGHVAAVYLAHVKAMDAFATPRIALRAQIPLTLLMVVYTFIGLSITAEPIVASREAAAAPSAIATAVEIPADAVLFDAQNNRLQPVGANRTAQVKLTYKTLGSAFHDGTRMNTADLIYAYAFIYRWGTHRGGEDAHYDPYVDAASEIIRQHLLALRIAGVDAASKSFRIGEVNFLRETFTVEVYLNIAPDDPEWNGAVAPPFSTLPWHLLALMEGAVERGWAAFSEQEARRRGVEWLDLARSKDLAEKLAALTLEYERDGARPEALRDYVSRDEARARWAAIAAFYKANKHFLVTNGPYQLRSWSADSVTLDAFRDLTYPLGVGSYDVYAIPRRGFITNTQWSGSKLTLEGDIEIINKFQRSYQLVRTPLRALPDVVVKRAAPECRYVVADAEGRIVLSGTAPIGAEGKFALDFTGQLAPGRYTLSALIAVNANLMNPDIRRIPLLVAGAR